jgi:hypothetical protein
MVKKGKALITRRALVQRINRKLAHDGERLVAKRTGSDGRRPEYSYYRIEGQRVVEKDVDVAKLARALDVLRPWEEAPR